MVIARYGRRKGRTMEKEIYLIYRRRRRRRRRERRNRGSGGRKK